jgi:membrane protease YdiL (CAAX protease family)
MEFIVLLCYFLFLLSLHSVLTFKLSSESKSKHIINYAELAGFIGIDSFLIFHAAVGEEFIFRILPDLFQVNVYIRLFISSIVFGALHSISILRESCRYKWKEKLHQSCGTAVFGSLLSLIQLAFTNNVNWYILCCFFHVFVNLSIKFSDIHYHVGTSSNGFVIIKNKDK